MLILVWFNVSIWLNWHILWTVFIYLEIPFQPIFIKIASLIATKIRATSPPVVKSSSDLIDSLKWKVTCLNSCYFKSLCLKIKFFLMIFLRYTIFFYISTNLLRALERNYEIKIIFIIFVTLALMCSEFNLVVFDTHGKTLWMGIEPAFGSC